MRTFLQHLVENKEVEKELPNSRGVLIHGSKLFVGVSHGTPPELTPQVHAMVKHHIKQYGHWNEGDGGDAKVTRNITGKAKAHGSFDTDMIDKALYTDKKGRRFLAPHHISNLFGNLPKSPQEAGVINTLTNSNMTLRDSVAANHDKILGSRASPEDVDTFFKQAGPHFERMSQKPADQRNVQRFIRRGAKDGWKGNENPDTGVGNMIRQAQLERENYLLDKAPPGVYFIGSGHLPSMSETVRSRGIKPRLIGGSHAHL